MTAADVRPWLLATGDFTPFGGMDRANHALASYLARTGRPVHLVAHRVASDLTSMRGVHVHHVARPAGAHLVGAPLLARAAKRQARALGRGARVLMNGGNGIVGVPTWVHYLHAAYEPEVAASLRTRISASVGRRYYLRRERAALRRAPLVICNSERTAEDVRRFYGVPSSRLRVVYYGSDAAAFGPATAEERLQAKRALGTDGRLAAVFIGALGDRRKGFDVVFEAWRRLSADPAWDVNLLVAGEGGEARAWGARAAQAGLGDRVKFLGVRRDVPVVLAAADVLVHPARYEAYGLGVHEAVCRGVPSIVTSIAGVTEKFPPTLGSLIVSSPPRSDALATALRAWRAGAEVWRARVAPIGDALRSRSWDDMSAEIVAAVEENTPERA
jgi:glycosyltransferase involved in cell wall biosynthesis